MSWSSPVLYHTTPGGKIKTWCVVTEGDSYCTGTSDLHGTVTWSAFTKCQAKNVGGSNERSPEQVAVDTAKSKMQAKLDENYTLSLEELEEKALIPRAMLARPSMEKEISKVSKAVSLRKCFVQPKLDGFRCLADRRGLWTRNLRKIETCQHIEKALKPVFEANPNLVIDGELYNHDLRNDFGKIQSLLTKTHVDMFDALEAENLIQYHVYDFVEEASFLTRFLGNKSLLEGIQFTKIVRTVRVKTVDSIYEKHIEFVRDGYEGTMVRISNSNYEQNKRAAQLLKLKDFQDEEFTIVSVNEGKGQWAGYAKSITCQMKGSEDTFDAGCSGTQQMLKTVLDRAEDYVGGKVTLQFFQKFPSGKPRFPVAIKYFTR